MSPIISGGGGSGGSSPSTATATLTTDPNTFLGSHVFNLGGLAHTVYVAMTILTLTGDGETWGTGVGQIQALQDTDPNYRLSFDNVTFKTRSSLISLEPDGIIVGAVQQGVLLTPRYLEVTVAIVDDTFTVYSGPNHPTAQVRFNLSYT